MVGVVVVVVVVVVTVAAASSVEVGRGGSRETFNMICPVTQNEL
jgi:hypothetical protein